jgi:hypothetical protein
VRRPGERDAYGLGGGGWRKVVLRGGQREANVWLPAVDPSATTLVLENGVAVTLTRARTWGPELPITAGFAHGSQSLTASDASGFGVGDDLVPPGTSAPHLRET